MKKTNYCFSQTHRTSRVSSVKPLCSMLGALAFLLFLATSCKLSDSPNIQISGDVKGLDSGTVYLQKFYNKMFFTIDSAKLVAGKFTFSKKLAVPELYGLTTDTTKYPAFVFLKDGDKLQVSLNEKNRDSASITGSADNDLYYAYKKKDADVKIDSFIQKNPKSIVSAYILYREYSYRLTPEELVRATNLLDASLQKTQYVNVLNELVTTLKKVQVGSKAIDFALPDTTGNEIKLSSHFGKVLLLDFWASWCPPCRAENPNLVKIYQKYKDKGFTIYAVSLDKKKEAWLKGIHDDKLTWTHVSDLTFWNSSAAKLYGIRAIPSNVLIDEKGTIIAKNLKGEALDAKLAEVLGAKSK